MDNLPWKHVLGDKLVEGTRPDLHPIVEAALIFLEANGLDTQGLFRVPGSASQVKVLKENFRSKKKMPELADVAVHTVCSLLTDHLRSEEPLLTYSLAPRWIHASGLPDLVVRLTKYVELINQLPLANHATLFVLLRLLVQISQHAEKTLMPATNLGTIFGPMICRRPNSDIGQELVDIPAVSKLCIDLITHFSQLFDYYDLENGGGGMMGGEGGFSYSPHTKKTTRRKFQFGKEKPFQGDRSGDRSLAAATPYGTTPMTSPMPSTSSPVPIPMSTPAAASPPAQMTINSPVSGSPVLPLHSSPVLAPEYESPAVVGHLDPSSDSASLNGRARKNALLGSERQPSPRSQQPDQPVVAHDEGGTMRSPKSHVYGTSPEVDGDDGDEGDRTGRAASGLGAKIDGKSVMRSLSSMGGFYSKNVSKPLVPGDDPEADAAAEEAGEEEEGKKDKKSGRHLPALNLKKRKDSAEKKLRMFSPRKLFDKDRAKAPDGAYDSSDSDRKYDGSSSSEREERVAEGSSGKKEMRFGGRMIPFRSPRRKSSSWPEAELAEIRRTGGHPELDRRDDSNSDSDDADGSGPESETPITPTGSTSAPGGQPRARSAVATVRSDEQDVFGSDEAQKRKGSQSERGPSTSGRAATKTSKGRKGKAGKDAAASASTKSKSSTWTNIEQQIRKERERIARDGTSPRTKRPAAESASEGGGVGVTSPSLASDSSGTGTVWLSSSPTSSTLGPAIDVLASLKSPRSVINAAPTAIMMDDQGPGDGGDTEAMTGRIGPDEELGLVKWKKRMAIGGSHARRREQAAAAAPADTVAIMGSASTVVPAVPTEGEAESGRSTTGLVYLLSKHYGGTVREEDGGETAKERPTSPTESVGTESESDMTETDAEETDHEVDDEGGTTSDDDQGSSGGGSGIVLPSGEEKTVKRRRASSAARESGGDQQVQGKTVRRPKSNASKKKLSSGSKKTTTKDSSGLKLGRKVKKGEENATSDEEEEETTHQQHQPQSMTTRPDQTLTPID